jgi:hypothetical protein
MAIRSFIRYLLGKSAELSELQQKDVLLGKVVLDIHRKRLRSEFVMVPLFALKQIHAIDRDTALASVTQRAETLRGVRDALLSNRAMTRETLATYLPSVSWIKVVRESPDSYIAYEGNGRLVALQQVFTPGDSMLVEVEEYLFRDPRRIIARMNRVRRMNGLLLS